MPTQNMSTVMTQSIPAVTTQYTQAISTRKPPSQQKSPNLLSLPPSLRQKILSHILRHPPQTLICLRRHHPNLTPKPWHEPPLLKVSRQIRRETTITYYASNNFIITLRSLSEIRPACDWLRTRYEQTCAGWMNKTKCAFGSLRFFVLKADPKDAPNLIFFAHLYHETGIELQSPPQHMSAGAGLENLFVFGAPNLTRLGRYTATLMEIGREARRSGMSKEELGKMACRYLESRTPKNSQGQSVWKCVKLWYEDGYMWWS